jgi:GDP-4-dehydro-6-deoxy-D-mannose reductase
MNNKTILITGAGGFIGNHLFRHLRSAYSSAQIVGTSRLSRAQQFVTLDLLQKEQILKLIEELCPDYIFHLAGTIHDTNLDSLLDGNLRATNNLLEVVSRCGVNARIVIPGSAAEYGYVSSADLPVTESQIPVPLTNYSITKDAQTKLTLMYARNGLRVVIGRIFNVIGAGMSNQLSIGAFAEQIRDIRQGSAKPILKVGNLHAKRDFLDIDDVCSALEELAKSGHTGQIYNICSGHSIPLEQIVDKMIEFSGCDIVIERDEEKFKPFDVQDIYGSIAKISRDTGWRSRVSLCDSIQKLMDVSCSDYPQSNVERAHGTH